MLDAATGQTWSAEARRPCAPGHERPASTDGPIEADLVDPPTALEFSATTSRSIPIGPRSLIELSGKGELGQSLAFPYPFVEREGHLPGACPVNEGMSYPVDDPSLPPMHYILYGGHGLCMAWWGVTDGRKGMMAIVETPDDASISVPRRRRPALRSPALGRTERDVRPGPTDPLRLLRRRRLRRHGQALSPVRPGSSGLFKTLAAEARREPERRPADRRGQRLVLGPGRRRDRRASCSRRASSASSGRTRRRPSQIKTHERAGRPDQPLRHLPGRHGPGDLPEAPLHPPRLADEGLARRPDDRRRWDSGSRAGRSRARTAGCTPAA